jgi:hypothetical protein
MSNDSVSDNFKCPYCGTANTSGVSSWEKVGYIPIICTQCASIFWTKLNLEREVIVVSHVPVFKTQIPELPEGTPVFVINKEHKKHLEPGVVAKRDHKHYKIKFHDGMHLWVPQHWVEPIPKEMLE